MTRRFWLILMPFILALFGCGDSSGAPGGDPTGSGGTGGAGATNGDPSDPMEPSATMPLPERGIPDPVLHDAPLEGAALARTASRTKGLGDLPGAAGTIGGFGERVERCVQRGGSLAECGGTAGLCLARDTAVGQIGGQLFDKLGLGELAKNYYCDGECFHCCWVPGSGDGGAGGGCHTSFDSSEGPVINCDPGIYGAGTVGLGPALVIGDALGLGICIGGVQQLCNHIAMCNGAGSSAGPGGAGAEGASTKSLTRQRFASGELGSKSTSEPPHENMSHPQAVYLHVHSFENAMRRNFFAAQRETPARARRKAYVDFITARGAVNWMRVLREIEPYNREFDVFAVTDGDGAVLSAESYHQGIVYHANLAFVGAVPNIVDRLGYVESRYWTEEEKTEYLDGIDPETELRKTMSPLVLDALMRVPIQDWRLLAQAAPNEALPGERVYDGFRLGKPPIITAAQDCIGESQVTLAVAIQDPEEANNDGSLYPVLVDWGDGFVSRHIYDTALPTNAYSHTYEEAGTFLAYVTTANSTGLRGVVGVVVEAEMGLPDPADIPAIATVQLDDVIAYGPSVSLAGDLTFELEVYRSLGPTEGIGWSDVHTLANAGPNDLGDIVGYNEALTPFETVVLRPFHFGGFFLDSVYFKTPSITLGFHDHQVGAIVTHTAGLTEEMLRVYYEGATEPVPAAELERDLNGDLILPVVRGNEALAPDFCGAEPCERVDRIEIDLTREMLSGRPPVSRDLPQALDVGDTARWVEDVPNVFVAAQTPGTDEVPATCDTVLEPTLVTPAEPASSFVGSLDIEPANAVVTDGSSVSLRAIATLLDGSMLDVTRQATWDSLDETVLAVSNGTDKGQLRGGTIPGTTTITATLADVTAETTASHDAASRGFQSYRIHFDAVHGSLGKAAISGVELIVDGRILESLMEDEDTGTIGPFPATVGSSEGSDPTYAFDVSGTVWSSAEESFSRDDPYAVGELPVYLEVNFEIPVPVDGVRLHRTAGILFASYGPWFPKQVRVQGSNDGVTFADIEGAATTFIGWNGEPALVEWDVP